MPAAFAPYSYTPIAFPQDDPHLVAMRADAALEEHAAPLFTPNYAAQPGGDEMADAKYYDYTTTLPKFIALAFINKGAAAARYANVTKYTGLIYFSELAAGSPGLVHGGALSTAVDTVAGESTVLRNEGLALTKSITVNFLKFVPLRSVVRFDCTPVDGDGGTNTDAAAPPQRLRPGKDFAVRTVLSNPEDPSHVYVDSVAIFTRPSTLPKIKREKGERQSMFEQLAYRDYVLMLRGSGSVTELWQQLPTTIMVASTGDAIWPRAARDASVALSKHTTVHSAASPPREGLQLAKMSADFVGMDDSWGGHCPPGDSFWETVPTGWDGVLVPYFDVEEAGNDAVAALYPVKLLRRLFWRRTPEPDESGGIGGGTKRAPFVVGVYYFGHLCQGPPNRAHGGSILTACDDIQGQLVIREVGFLPTSNTIELTVSYLGPTPMSEPVIVVARLRTAAGSASSSRVSETEAIAFRATDFFGISGDPCYDCFNPTACTPCFRSTALWKQAKPSKMGLKRAQSYDETLANFRNGLQPENFSPSQLSASAGELKSTSKL